MSDLTVEALVEAGPDSSRIFESISENLTAEKDKAEKEKNALEKSLMKLTTWLILMKMKLVNYKTC